MHTTRTSPDTELAALIAELRKERLRLKITMIRAQTTALETLERFMAGPVAAAQEKPDEKQERAEAAERNRKRLAATQTLIHCRNTQREQRLAQANRAKHNPPSSKGEGIDPSANDRQRSTRSKSSGGQHAESATGDPSGSAGLREEVQREQSTDDPTQGPACAATIGVDAPAPSNSSIFKPKRTRFKVRKPRHPRPSRKRRRKQNLASSRVC